MTRMSFTVRSLVLLAGLFLSFALAPDLRAEGRGAVEPAIRVMGDKTTFIAGGAVELQIDGVAPRELARARVFADGDGRLSTGADRIEIHGSVGSRRVWDTSGVAQGLYWIALVAPDASGAPRVFFAPRLIRVVGSERVHVDVAQSAALAPRRVSAVALPASRGLPVEARGDERGATTGGGWVGAPGGIVVRGGAGEGVAAPDPEEPRVRSTAVTISLSGDVVRGGEEEFGVGDDSAAGDSGSKGGGTPGLGDGDDGSDGQDGGTVAVTVDLNGYDITTTGKSGHGIFVPASGGRGGDGGNGKGIKGEGGTGGDGGDGGSATVRTIDGGAITTWGSGAAGIAVNANGGRGGEGGDAGGLEGDGGEGGAGGNGGTAIVDNAVNIRTYGADAHGIFVQSGSGSGGNGGDAEGPFPTGGAGDESGRGGIVEVTNRSTATVQTSGRDAHGILAQSIGGFGGDGGDEAGIRANGGNSASGGDGGRVTVNQYGSVLTGNEGSHGVLAQSIGGGGGAGGSGAGLVASGASGSPGGHGGAVTVTQSGAIVTTGTASVGLFVQSIGGGGGEGGDGGGVVAIGGDGASAGNGGTVTVSGSGGSINTYQADSHGILAQSIGGGGGSGGSSGGVVAIGGEGDSGGSGGTVRVTTDTAIRTRGDDATGVFAQSIGGGGGNGGSSVGAGAFVSISVGGAASGGGSGGVVRVTTGSEDIGTEGERSHGIHAQSVGGGGGNGGYSVAASAGLGGSISVGVGGRGGPGGDGSTVEVSSGNDIETSKADSHGILAQSVGGGGGGGGYAVAASISDAVSISVGVGGGGGGGGHAGDSSVTHTGASVSTRGDRSSAILVQSMGGGGGSGGFSVAGGISGGPALQFGIGGTGGGGGDAGSTALETSADIATRGKQAHGLVAQSIGGGGGGGGFAVAGGISTTASVGAALGGSGSGGGSAGIVRVEHSGDDITTEGARAHGILAQSIGGGGGDGGFAVGAGLSAGQAVSFGMGGDAAEGGTGSFVSVSTSASIETKGEKAYAILAQSIGGGGGSGGFSVAGGVSGGASVSVGLGGNAGGGASGGDVTVAATGTDLRTAGRGAHGLVAQSVGGGGGDGGFSVAGSIAGGAGVNFGLGGSAAQGGTAGNVTASNAGAVRTLGHGAHGLVAQSVGGGGGNGGFAVGAGLSSSSSIAASLGGAGAGGGTSGGVALTNTGSEVRTYGDRSYGLLAQSLGGGGGDGGFAVAGGASSGAAVTFGMGGAGAIGGRSGTVVLVNAADVGTLGRDAHAIVAQSIGGGGGSGGFSVSAGLSSSTAVSAGLGGKGAGGGHAGGVSVDNTGTLIETAGDRAYGLLAQSAGGGGGDGGFAVGGALGGEGSVGFGLGGAAGGGSDGGRVVVTTGADVKTRGQDAHGLVAQSIGGGGGSGGFAVGAGIGRSGALAVSLGGSAGGGGDASEVSLTNTGSLILTEGHRAYGALAQSLGGGGGDGGFSVSGGIAKSAAASVGLGGTGGEGGRGGAVSLSSSAAVGTKGESAHALVAQSVGGGGGSGGFSAAASLSSDGNVTVGLGGSGDTGGAAGAVKVENTGAVLVTEGDRAHGLLAQSLGGGGGDGGFAVAGGIAKTASVSFGMGGSGAGGGAASQVEVVNAADVSTRGHSAHGLFAQSAGGGGGSGGFSVSAGLSAEGSVAAALGGAAGGGSDGGRVALSNTGSVVVTRGDRAYGILAQSLGGGGGDGGFAVGASIAKAAAVSFGLGGTGGGGGSAADVRIENEAEVATFGVDAHAIVAQSIGGGGGSGGFAVAGGVAKTASINAGIGGAGGVGGDAGSVVLDHTGATVVTSGRRAYGLLAQSVGGGGGDGGFGVAGGLSQNTSISLGIGGGGGVAGDGGDVSLTTTAAAWSRGDDAHAIAAQSIGGGGGTGGFAFGLAVGAKTGAKAVSFSMGGSGGAGGNAGDVAIDATGDVVTEGRHSYGVVAQSVGGGGGDGGFAIAGAFSGEKAAAVSLGGTGGSAGASGDVSLWSTGAIGTGGDVAHGLFAQSVGGGGGSGGFSFAASGSVADTGGHGLGVSLGGNGGGGGDAGAVDLDNAGIVRTEGAGAHAVFAQSVGGGGGAGGFSGTVRGGFGEGASLAVALGGKGGTPGTGDDVDVTSSGPLITSGRSSYGLFAQSVGGGGGDGGGSLAAAIGTGEKDMDVSVAIGGEGSVGGSAGHVTVHNAGIVDTSGDKSHAVLAQSIGGGGGNGGFSVAGTIGGGKNSKQLSVALGGAGGDGGAAGDVRVTNEGDIITRGGFTGFVEPLALPADTPPPAGLIETMDDGAMGIVAQSIGGGGGNGGWAFSGAFGGTISKNVAVSVGGSGGEGGVGGLARVENLGTVETVGESSHGILAQSIGGGGGNGGAAIGAGLGFGGKKGTWNVNASIAVGGFGGSGNAGGAVQVENWGAIVTRGLDAVGIYAQSVGGGGGTGGQSFVATVGLGAANEGRTLNTNISVGGEGGSGGVGGTVDVSNEGRIETHGHRAHGIAAQSIGGGGGDGGRARNTSLIISPGGKKADKSKGNWQLRVSVGGNGGTANHGGAVRVANDGDIVMHGSLTRGISAQSIGGGGGSGGTGANMTETEADYAVLATGVVLGPDSLPLGLFRQLDLTVGGSAGASGDGGAVTIENRGRIDARAHLATGIFAQSIGGGGGVAEGFEETVAAGGQAVVGATGKFAIAGAGGAAGSGGEVSIEHRGDIQAGKDGIFAQSIGGGGGVAGGVDRLLPDGLPIEGGQDLPGRAKAPPIVDVVQNLGIGLAFGRDGGSAGDGGDVRVASGGTITAYGHGIFAQSVGGGGGLAGGLGNLDEPYLLSFAGGVGGQGSGGNVVVDHTGSIVTYFSDTPAIFAQSVGGTPDASGEGGTGGAVTVNVRGGAILANGWDAAAITAQSVGLGGNGDITVTVDADSFVQGGPGDSSSIRILDGANNRVVNYGIVTTLNGAAGNAITGTTGNDDVFNDGVVIGSVVLGGGANNFTNTEVAIFESLDGVVLGGSGNALANRGVLSPGGTTRVYTTDLEGDFSQSADGAMIVNVDRGTANAVAAFSRGSNAIGLVDGLVTDKLVVSGTAEVAGVVQLMVADMAIPRAGDAYPILTAPDGVVGTFDDLLGDPFVGNYAIELGLEYRDDGVYLVALQDSYVPFAGTPNQIATARALDSAAADPRQRPLIDRLNEIPAPLLPHQYDRVAPEELGSLFDMTAAVTRLSSGTLWRRMENIRLRTRACAAAPVALCRPTEDPCADRAETLASFRPGQATGWAPLRRTGSWSVWADGAGRFVDQDGDWNASGYDIRLGSFTVGADKLLNPRLAVGGALGYAHGDADLAEGGEATLDAVRLHAYATLFDGGWYVDAAVGGAFNFYDSERQAVDGRAKGSTQGHEVDVFLRAGYDWRAGRWILGPSVGLEYAWIHVDGFTESGSLSPLSIQGQDHHSLYGMVGGRVAYEGRLGGLRARPEVRAEYLHGFEQGERAVTAGFASGAGDPFRVTTAPVGKDVLSITAGLTLDFGRRWQGWVYYNAQRSEGTIAHAYGAGLGIDF